MADGTCRYCGRDIVFRIWTDRHRRRRTRVFHVGTGWPCWRARHGG